MMKCGMHDACSKQVMLSVALAGLSHAQGAKVTSAELSGHGKQTLASAFSLSEL